MNIIFLLIIVSLIVALGFLAAFIWAVKSGQYEDDYTPSVRMLFDDSSPAVRSLKRSGNPESTSGSSDLVPNSLRDRQSKKGESSTTQPSPNTKKK